MGSMMQGAGFGIMGAMILQENDPAQQELQ